MDNRRDFFKKSALIGLTGIVSGLAGKETLDRVEAVSQRLAGGPAFKLPPLPYAYNALEPFIDKQTMEIHHSKHHQAYIDKLNATPSTNLDYQANDTNLCKSVDQGTSPVIRNNLGGYFNHSLFWTLMKPNPGQTSNLPSGALGTAINSHFRSFDDFKKEFKDNAMKIFGSGWCWLILQNGKLKITSTPNQDNPLMKVAAEQGDIVLALDVWEHAYYLKHQNKRADYIDAWWNVVNWSEADKLFNAK